MPSRAPSLRGRSLELDRGGRIVGRTVTADSATWRLCDLLLRRPVLNARAIADELAIPVGNVHRYVAPLLAASVLVETRDVTRNQIWRAPRILAALDAFATRAGRRPSSEGA